MISTTLSVLIIPASVTLSVQIPCLILGRRAQIGFSDVAPVEKSFDGIHVAAVAGPSPVGATPRLRRRYKRIKAADCVIVCHCDALPWLRGIRLTQQHVHIPRKNTYIAKQMTSACTNLCISRPSPHVNLLIAAASV